MCVCVCDDDDDDEMSVSFSVSALRSCEMARHKQCIIIIESDYPIITHIVAVHLKDLL